MAATHSQPTGKRQKVRDARVDNLDYFQGIDKLEYNNMASPTDAGSYRYYNSSERLHSRAMDDWLKYSVSFTEFRSSGRSRLWNADDSTNSLENHKRSLKAFFDLMTKLGIKYWTALDTDLVPWSESWEAYKAGWEEMLEYIQELGHRGSVKLLWLAPDLQSHARYASGAVTSNEATTFIQAASQIKKCLEVSQRLNAECFLIYPHREGYEKIFQTDVSREIKLFSKLLKITAEYKDRLNYRCQLLIMPYYNCNLNYSCNIRNYSRNFGQISRENDVVNSYMWDVTSCLYLLKNFNLDRYYRVCTPPGHHMYMANAYNMLGGVVITNSFDQYDSKTLTLMMKCIVDHGSTLPGGVHLALRPCSGDLRDLLTTYTKYIDSVARALRVACSLVADQVFSKHVQQRYASYYSGMGARLISGEVSLEECEEYYKKSQNQQSEASALISRGEQFDVALQRCLDACD